MSFDSRYNIITIETSACKVIEGWGKSTLPCVKKCVYAWGFSKMSDSVYPRQSPQTWLGVGMKSSISSFA